VLAICLLTNSIVSSMFRYRRWIRTLCAYAQKRSYTLLNPSLAKTLDAPMLEALRHVPAGGWVLGVAGITDIDTFKDGSNAGRLGFVCQVRSREVTIFNFQGRSSSVGHGKSRKHVRGALYRVAKIRQPGLPHFSLARRSGLDELGRIVDRLVGEPDLSVREGAAPDFFRKYSIRSREGRAVFAFLSAERQQFLQRRELCGSLGSNGEYLVYWESGQMHTEEEYDLFISTVDQLIAHLVP
jgi:hypothetical protein